MALAVGPMSAQKRTQGAVGRPPEWRVGRFGRPKTSQSQYRAEVAAPPGRQGGDNAIGEDIPPSIQGGMGYSVDTGRVIGPPPPPPVGIPITGPGASVQPVSLSLMPFLNAAWTQNGVTLSWGTPDYDPNQFTLLRYDINRFVYGPNSTAPHAIFVGGRSGLQCGARLPEPPDGGSVPWSRALRQVRIFYWDSWSSLLTGLVSGSVPL
ncbi:MAG: hypothetical protein E6K90_05805 [Thaumarchaeota archaeon]|nr:MAG: hypothetical protein E6K90_05805 [Nitrososphaerota archaeon]